MKNLEVGWNEDELVGGIEVGSVETGKQELFFISGPNLEGISGAGMKFGENLSSMLVTFFCVAEKGRPETKLSTTTLSITTLSITTLSIMTLSITTLSITTLSTTLKTRLSAKQVSA